MSLDGPYDQDNIFAKMLRGEMSCVKVHEDDVALAIMDLFPQGPGHTLAIPKIAARNFLDFPPAAIGPYMQRVQTLARAIRQTFVPDGIWISQFNGAAAGQSVFHLHFHIIPRWSGAPLTGHGQAKMADLATLQEQAKKIAAAL